MKFLRFPIFILLILVGFFQPAISQQTPVYSQYMWNDFAINPSVAGTQRYFKINASIRNQWVKVQGYPMTMNVAMYGPLKEYNMGYGGAIYYDKVNAESLMRISGSYAYNMQLKGFWRISGGLALGYMQYALDGTALDPGENVDDPAIPANKYSQGKIDGAVGFSVYNHQYYFGISAHHLFGNKFDFYDDNLATDTTDSKGVNRLKQHLYLVGNMKISLNRDWFVQPTVMLKTVFPDQFQVDIGGIATWKKMVWGGITYRNPNMLNIMAGYNHENVIMIGISYDIGFGVSNTLGGVWEVMVGYNFQPIK